MQDNSNFKSSLAAIRQERIDKAQKLKDLGIDPYPSKAQKDISNKEIIDNYENYENKSLTLAGRLVSKREHGALLFGHIQDQTGEIQLYIKSDELALTSKENQTIGFDDLNLIDVGDIVQATGQITKTQRGEISLLVKELRLLTKSIRPLPDKHEGIKDKELLFRQRYLDMISHPEKRKRFEMGSKTVFAIRQFMFDKGFLEIKTPIIQPVYGGSTAKPFRTHVNALGEDYYLAIAHELYLKRLIVAGFENVFNIVGYFRNEGIDRTHNPEFSMLETMSAFHNYEFNMDLLEEMYQYIAKNVFGKNVFKISGQDVDFSKKWEKIKMIDAVKKYAGVDFDEIQDLQLAQNKLKEAGYKDEMPRTIGECMFRIFETKVEEHLIQPTFVYGHPVEISPLAKSMADDPRFAERFEVFIGGIEAGDNWSELNDPVELFERFKIQAEKGRGGDEEAHPMDIEFVEAMEYGMPPTTGIGPGIERLLMMFTETDYIDDVIFFPMQRPAPVTKVQKEIYGEENISKSTNNKKQDKTKRFAIVIDEALKGWQLNNVIAHVGAYLGNQIPKESFASKDSFTTKDGEMVKPDSQYPVVTFASKKTKLSNLIAKLKESELVYMGFTREMLEIDDDKEVESSISSKISTEIEYLAVGIFGNNDEIKKFTNSFSLWK